MKRVQKRQIKLRQFPQVPNANHSVALLDYVKILEKVGVLKEMKPFQFQLLTEITPQENYSTLLEEEELFYRNHWHMIMDK